MGGDRWNRFHTGPSERIAAVSILTALPFFAGLTLKSGLGPALAGSMRAGRAVDSALEENRDGHANAHGDGKQ
jgi:hypothetical protein